jgi:leucyl/phenylalanyl-tRNA--protein transferase
MARRGANDLSPATLLSAYAQGAFPMAAPGTGRVQFYTCPVRCVFPLERFRPSASLARRVRSGRFEIAVNRDFAATTAACATDRGGGNRTWISPSMQAAYGELHRLGHAHSVEAWRDGRLVGGLYGVTLGGAFFGESMFVRRDLGGTDASKVCLVHLVDRLRERGFTLLDSQFANDHVLRLGAEEIPADEYLRRLARAIALDATFG